MRSATRLGQILAVALALACGARCAAPISPAPLPEGWREQLAKPLPPPPPDAIFPLPAARLESLLRSGAFEIRAREDVGGLFSRGSMRVFRLTAYYPSIDRTLSLKWKAAPVGGEERNNTPRREIAAYRLQKWFLAEPDYVVPPTLGLCIPLDRYARIDADAHPNLPGADCVFGAQAIWLERVEGADPLFDLDRFVRDPRYARHLAHYNLVMYLIQNRDTRPANVLVSTEASNRRVFSVDNGITFGERIYNPFRHHWHTIRVPALPADAIERLRRVSDEQLQGLALVAEFRAGADRVLRESPPSAAFEPEEGVRRKEGVLQLGLEPREIEGVRARLRELFTAVDAGEIPTF